MEAIIEATHLSWAAWTSLDTGLVSFSRDWKSRSLPEIWWGEDHLMLKSLQRVAPERFGLLGGYYGRAQKIHFVLPDELLYKIPEDELIYVAGSFNGWQQAIGNPDWQMEPGEVDGQPCRVLSVPQSRLQDEEDATFKFVTASGQWISVPENARNTHVDKMGIKNYLFCSNRSGRHLFRFKTPLTLNQSEDRNLYVRIGDEVESIRMNPGVFLKSMDAPGPLGAIVEANRTRFRLFAPRARAVSLYVFENRDGPEGIPVELRLGRDQVWETSLEGNLHGWFYHYTVTGQEVDESGYFDPEFRILDPFARAVCGPLGPGIIVDSGFFNTQHVPFNPPHWHDLVIAEAHVRDLTANAPLELEDEERLGFRGLNKWIDHEAFYLRQLGVNAVELQPVHEFDSVDPHEYAWGYMPINYFSPASQYCRDASKLDQVTEFRDTVRKFHEHGIAVLLDVVYNHVGEPNYLQYLDRQYYFMLGEEGHYQNYSGCGNTIDASTPVMRRLIRDSLVHWIEAYDVDGFRFDLGELIGVDTFSWLEQELQAVKPGIILIAEPWSFRGHIGIQLKETGFASWNDGFREYIRKFLTLKQDSRDLGYFMQGSHPDWSRFPAQTVNYLSSHDDRCWIDKITENRNYDGHRPTASDRRRTHLAVATLMMSLGIPMISSGMDMMKSKGGVNNTYLRGDLNAIPYFRMAEHSGTVEYFRNWIRFRLGELGRFVRLDGFPGSGYFATSTMERAFGMIYNHDYSHGNERLLFVINTAYDSAGIVFGGTDLSSFVQLADTERWGMERLGLPVFPVHGNRINVPAQSCGLFIERN